MIHSSSEFELHTPQNEIMDDLVASMTQVTPTTPTLQAPHPTTSFLTALVAGGMAGTSVDIALFPIDTIKTRLQAPQGFLAAGGFRGIYQGLGAAAAGSAPGAALFFSVYEVGFDSYTLLGVLCVVRSFWLLLL